MVKIGINGFGRIGRIAFRIWLQKHTNEIEIAAINTSGSMNIEGWAHLVNYDTMYRKFQYEVTSEKVRDVNEMKKEAATPLRQGSEGQGDDLLIGYLLVSGKDIKIPVLAQRDPEKIPWSKYEVEIVIESTGAFTKEEDAKKHAIGGAKRVVLSAPAKGGNVSTYVLGVNEYKGKGEVLSNASCTTNCVAPVAAVMHSAFGVEKALMTTVHSYTDDQNLQDNSHKDLRRARAAAENIIPTTTGAAIATTETIPELKGLFDGMSLRVPTATGSISDFTFLLKKKVTVEEVNNALTKAAKENALFKGILAVSNEPLVSSDIIGRSESAIVDLNLWEKI